MSGIIKKHVHPRIWNIKVFFKFCFLWGVIEFLSFVKVRLFLFTCSVNFAEMLHNFTNII